MKVISASHEIFPDIVHGEETKRIELIARVCYKSEDLICDGSDVKMVKGLVTRKHYAMLEHATAAFELCGNAYDLLRKSVSKLSNVYKRPFYFNFVTSMDGVWSVSGNLRTWLEYITCCQEMNFPVPKDIVYYLKEIPVIFDGVDPIVEDTPCSVLTFDNMDYDQKIAHTYKTVKFICDRGVSHELVRHRPCSFAQESTRYCNYGKEDEITVIRPLFWDNAEKTNEYKAWYDSCKFAEKTYVDLIRMGAKPQEARSILPNSVKTEIVVTTNLKEWCHIFNLRALDKTGPAHPQMKEIMVPVYEEFLKEYSFIEDYL